MDWTDDFDPISEVSGNIEITFSSKNKEFDMYEPIQDQLVLTIGKTGRANRLSFDKPDSEEILETARTLQAIGEELEKLEDEMSEDEDEFDISNIESGVNSTPKSTIKDKMPKNDGIKFSKLKEKVDIPENEFPALIEEMKRAGEMYVTGEGEEDETILATI